MSAQRVSNAMATLVGCNKCDLLSRMKPVPRGYDARCPRCGAVLHTRKPDSLARTWALIIAAAILYIPANVYPVMTVKTFASTNADTILDGVKALFASGWWSVGLLLFFASFCVPMLKLFGLSYLLLTVHLKSSWRPRPRTVWYRVIRSIGRWSMLDVFTLSILVALLQFGKILSVLPGVGASAFGAVVVLTMFAAMTFDPRLIWDNAILHEISITRRNSDE